MPCSSQSFRSYLLVHVAGVALLMGAASSAQAETDVGSPLIQAAIKTCGQRLGISPEVRLAACSTVMYSELLPENRTVT